MSVPELQHIVGLCAVCFCAVPILVIIVTLWQANRKWR
jgi:hypothetical protein